MITKTLGTFLIVLICIVMFPIGIGIVGGVLGIVFGVFAAVFGAIGGILGGVFGAIFGVFGWLFDGLFHWRWPFGFFHCNIFSLAAIAIIIALVLKARRNHIK